jgi:stage II sporulation protein D
MGNPQDHGARARRVTPARSLVVLLAVVAGVLHIPTASAAAPVLPTEPSGWSLGGVRFEADDPRGVLSVDGVGDYRGAVEVVRDGGGLSVISDVGLEDYVRGIAEVPPSWPLEAQKAQAVAARTYALWQARVTTTARFRGVGADICATQACQVYTGVAAERRAGADRWSHAVDATAGQLLLHEGRLIKAMYSSSNGGRSHSGGVPWLPAIDDPDDLATSPHARWRSVVDLGRVAGAFPGDGDLIEVRREGADVVLLRRQPLPPDAPPEAADDAPVHHETVTPAAFRAAMNRGPAPAGLPVTVLSTRFVIHTDGHQVVIDGAGFGHFLGMSQYGALGKARRGLSSDDILAAYYGGIRPEAFPPDRLPATVRVAMAHDRGAVAVTSADRFRVVADDGTVLAHLAEGRWEARPVPGGVRLTGPPGYDAPLAIAVLAADPPLPEPGEAVRVRLAVSAPASLRVRDAGGDDAPVDLGVLPAGEHDIDLPVVGGAGSPALVVQAQAGPERVAEATVILARAEPVAPPASVVGGPDAPAPGELAGAPLADPVPVGLALPALLAALAAAGVSGALALHTGAAGVAGRLLAARRARRTAATLG